jgi:hypothetical protein
MKESKGQTSAVAIGSAERLECAALQRFVCLCGSYFLLSGSALGLGSWKFDVRESSVVP